MRTSSPLLLTGLGAALTLCALPALSQSQCDWTIGIAHHVNPKSDNGTLAGGALPLRIDSDIKPTATLLRGVRTHPARCVSHSYPSVRGGANG
ncbi:hypothetical protein A6R71_09460 [Xanthomonas translucens pv. arrhenatheri]|uniref:Secreted protein n=1 Tax=Xanthomonas graminis pv. arrhenatheri LMG 727 TaxID=1195923 RepID=A0A0K2ZKZ0_9XANT|nr:hypothetical protein [Xanthomonas translucens]OAX64966.1 hypothetical protein A6R71_09460 [Xanthomonas translucens pv. arrhenatheri]UKE78312.1 hypothetical protein KM317_03460 [Xanthomonas translucens pv. arrhenatheri]CTP85597.1 hypothetical protein XTALMG727_1388 [Xanthomonas translucens pv. arrhenatheri LMG 727]